MISRHVYLLVLNINDTDDASVTLSFAQVLPHNYMQEPLSIYSRIFDPFTEMSVYYSQFIVLKLPAFGFFGSGIVTYVHGCPFVSTDIMSSFRFFCFQVLVIKYRSSGS